MRFPATGASTVAGVPLTAVEPTAGLLCIAVLLLAGILLGRLPALAAGLVVGAVRSVFDTHQAVTILEYALAGWAIAELVRQDYCRPFLFLLRRPWGAAIAASLFLILLRFGGELGSARGDPITLFDYALGRLPGLFRRCSWKGWRER